LCGRNSVVCDRNRVVCGPGRIVRSTAKPALVQIIEYPDDPAKVDFRAEFYRTLEDARTSVRFQGDHHRAEILGASGERLVGRSGCLSGFPQRRE
jgi:hypothetical protein